MGDGDVYSENYSALLLATEQLTDRLTVERAELRGILNPVPNEAEVIPAHKASNTTVSFEHYQKLMEIIGEKKALGPKFNGIDFLRLLQLRARLRQGGRRVSGFARMLRKLTRLLAPKGDKGDSKEETRSTESDLPQRLERAAERSFYTPLLELLKAAADRLSLMTLRLLGAIKRKPYVRESERGLKDHVGQNLWKGGSQQLSPFEQPLRPGLSRCSIGRIWGVETNTLTLSSLSNDALTQGLSATEHYVVASEDGSMQRFDKFLSPEQFDRWYPLRSVPCINEMPHERWDNPRLAEDHFLIKLPIDAETMSIPLHREFAIEEAGFFNAVGKPLNDEQEVTLRECRIGRDSARAALLSAPIDSSVK